MMSIGAVCPDPTKLKRYARGDATPADAAALDRHLADCRTCLNRYVELGNRSLVPEVPDCHVVKEIGRGRFGVVYKAWRLNEKPRIVALKVLTCPGEMEKSRFDREITVLKKLDSPWIVKCLESGTTGDAMYYVMDFVEGDHLDEYLASSTRDLNGKLAVFQRVCRAVADAHAKGVIHRDLKPRNILIDTEGEPHILDFGICAVETGDWSSWARHTITHPGDIIGTLRYMSPEQAWGGVARAIDERSDIWALGIMLYEIVTGGDYPYSLEATPDKPVHEALLERIRKELPRLPRLESLPRGRDLEVLLARCLAWEPDRRIESAAKLADDLERYGGGRRIKTKPFWIPYRLRRLAVGAAVRSRWMFSVGFIAAVGMTLWLTTILFGVGWQVTGHDYQGQKDPAEAVNGLSPARDGILVVGVFDDTVDAVVNFAKQKQIGGVTSSRKTWRAVHGYLMERLAQANPKAVVWDYYFQTPQSGDARFVAGVMRLEETGVPVVLAALTYRENGAPDLSPGIAEPLAGRLRHGVIVARDMVQRPGEFVIAIKQSSASVVPSLALTTLATVLHPDTRLDLEWPGRNLWVNVLYEIEPGAYLRERDRIGLTKVFKAGFAQYAARAGDLLACNTFELEKPKHWERRTVPYQTLLLCPNDELRSLVMNKLIIIGDLRSPQRHVPHIGFGSDWHRVKYGPSVIEDVPGCYLLADAIAGLLERRYMKSAFPLEPTRFLVILVAATAGCLLPIVAAARATGLAKTKVPKPLRYPGLLWTGLVTLSMTCLVVMILADGYAAVHLGMVGFSLLTPMAGSFWVEFTRNRHRTAERNPDVHRAEPQASACANSRVQKYSARTTDGTITLPLK